MFNAKKSPEPKLDGFGMMLKNMGVPVAELSQIVNQFPSMVQAVQEWAVKQEMRIRAMEMTSAEILRLTREIHDHTISDVTPVGKEVMIVSEDGSAVTVNQELWLSASSEKVS